MFGTIFLALEVFFKFFNAISNKPLNEIPKGEGIREKWRMEKIKKREDRERKKSYPLLLRFLAKFY